MLTEHEVRLPRATDWSLAHPRSLLAELDWRRWTSFQRRAWVRYRRVQVFTERDARAVARLAPEVGDRVRVNPFGIAMPPLPDPGREEPGSLLFVGNFTHAPNRDGAQWLVREILPLIRAERPGVRLRIVGSSPPPPIRSLAGPDVEVVADAPHTRPYLEAAAVVVAPLRIGGGMRLKVLLGLACGKAVVTTTRGAEGFIVSGERPFELRDDAEGIAAATAELLGNDGRRRELGDRARLFAQRHHSLAAWGARLQAVYEEAARSAS